MPYPESINLPFNAASIRAGFVPMRPGAAVPETSGYWAVIQGMALVVVKVEQDTRLPEGEMPDWFQPLAAPVCIGSWQGRPLRAAAIDKNVALPEPFKAEHFYSMSDKIDDATLTLGGLAHQIIQWQLQSVLCSRCGGRLEHISGSWGKKCNACGHEFFPHIHPCIIVLVRRGDEFLLVRKPEWAVGRYSLIAGFLDFGESLEECVQRETEEEAGVKVKNIRYVGSQSWPFPSQLMNGFVAEYDSGCVRPDGIEVIDARWFSRQQMPDALPGRRSIARWIIDRYGILCDTDG